MMELFTGVDWKKTVLLNSIRAVFAGIVWAVFAFYVGDTHVVLHFLIGMIFMYWLFIFPIGYLSAKLSEMGIPFAGLFSLLMSFIVLSFAKVITV